MAMRIQGNGPYLIGKVGKVNTSKVWHLLSHSSGGSEKEQQYILSSCGATKFYPWIKDGATFDLDKFWLCKPNNSFTIRYHSFWNFTSGEMCYVDHYYYANKIGELIIIEFTGQHNEWFNKPRFKLYKVGDECRHKEYNIIICSLLDLMFFRPVSYMSRGLQICYRLLWWIGVSMMVYIILTH